jgi:hypothetical protein
MNITGGICFVAFLATWISAVVFWIIAARHMVRLLKEKGEAREAARRDFFLAGLRFVIFCLIGLAVGYAGTKWGGWATHT